MSKNKSEKTFAEIFGTKGEGTPIEISKGLKDETEALNKIATAVEERGEAERKLDKTLYNQ